MVLVIPLALSWSLPALARVVAGPPVHVCHCDMRHGHATCACPKCFPERQELAFSEDALRGQCGDEDVTLRETKFVDAGVFPADFAVSPVLVLFLSHLDPPGLRSETFTPPPQKPPKLVLAA